MRKALPKKSDSLDKEILVYKIVFGGIIALVIFQIIVLIQ